MADHAGRMRIVVLGYIVRGPVGGLAWHHLHYVAGLHALGHDVVFLEDSGDDAYACYDPTTHRFGSDPSYGIGFAAAAFGRLGLGDRWAYYDAPRGQWLGPLGTAALTYCRSADLLINVSAANALRPWLEDVPRRMLIDTDPAFEQIRQLAEPDRAALAAQHNDFFTFGANVGDPDCLIPGTGVEWKPTRQPVWLQAWPVRPPRPDGPFTTVMQWESYETRQHLGTRYGMKSMSFDEIRTLPQRSDERLEIALGGERAPRQALEHEGWVISDPLERARDPWSYQRFITDSKAEFSVAKHGYVVSRSGWFSERTANYLAAGRPAVVEDTGFTRWLPTGAGVLAFSNLDEAAGAVHDVSADYEAHCAAARGLANDYFDSTVVLTELLDG